MKLAIAILFLAVQAQAATLYVSTTGTHNTNAPAFSTWTTAATNIQAAINAASAGDTVMLGEGTYFSKSAISITKSNLTLTSRGGTLFDADKTIISGGLVTNVFGVVFEAGRNFTLRGVSVVDGYVATNCAGLSFDSSVGATIDSCIFRGCRAGAPAAWGGGGAAVFSYNTKLALLNSVIVGNHIPPPGGAVHLHFPTDGYIAGCIIESNFSNQVRWANITAVNSIIGNGTSTNTGGGITSNTENSVCRAYGVSAASDGVGTNLIWAGIRSYIPRIGSLANNRGVVSTNFFVSARSGDGGPVFLPVSSGPAAAQDLTTNANHLVCIGAVSSTNGPIANWGSQEFDGFGSDIVYDSSVSLGATSNFTMECWAFFYGDGREEDLFCRGGYVAGEVYIARLSTRKICVVWGGTTLDYSVSATPANTWVHIAWSVSNGNSRVFLNGVSNAMTRWYGAGTPSIGAGKPISLGARLMQIPSALSGRLADARFWNYARTTNEVLADYTNRLTGTEPGLIGYWKLDNYAPLIEATTGPFNIRNPTLNSSFMEAF